MWPPHLSLPAQLWMLLRAVLSSKTPEKLLPSSSRMPLLDFGVFKSRDSAHKVKSTPHSLFQRKVKMFVPDAAQIQLASAATLGLQKCSKKDSSVCLPPLLLALPFTIP